MKLLIAFLAILLTLFQQPDHSDKKCVVTQLTVGGLHTDCAGWQAPANEKIMMPAEVNKRLKSGDTFRFVWKGDRWVAEIKEEPQEGFQIPTEFAGRKRAGCVVMRSNDSWVRGLCQVRTVVDLAYDKEEKRAGENGLAELFFPRKPSWRWPLSVEPGTPFYFEQIESHGKELVICRAIYGTDQTQMIASKTTSPPLCD